VNPVLLRGEAAVEIDTGKVKYGDGATAWRDLPYGRVEVVDGGVVPGASSVTTTIKLRRGAASGLYDANPVLAAGEPALETDTNKFKYGDGETAWRDLPYATFDAIDGGEISPVPPGGTEEFSPPNLPGLALWLDASDANYVSMVNNRVSQWSDKSANRRHFFQSLKASRPVNSNTVNSLGVVTFDGENDAMLSSFELGSEFTLFVVLNARGSSTDGRVLTALNHATDTDPAGFIPCITEDGNNVGVRVGSEYLGMQEITTFAPAVYGLSCSAESFTTRLNGLNPLAVENSISDSFTDFALGSSRASYASGAFDGDVAEVVLYEGVLSDEDRQTVEAYLLGRWGITQVVHPLLNGMTAFWPMNEENGSREDASGNNKTFVVGTGAASQVVNSSSGVIGRAATFTGDNYLEADIVTPVTSFSCWFKIDPANAQKAYHQLIGQWKSGGSWILNHTPTGINMTINNGDASILENGVNLADGLWHHVVGTYDNGTYRLYVDNEVYGSVASTAPANSSETRKLRVGICDYDDGNDYRTIGSIDSVGVWSRTLSPLDVAMLYNAGFGKEEFAVDLYGDNVSLLLHMNRLPNAATGGGGTDQYWDNVSLLLHMDEDFADSSANDRQVVTSGSVSISASESKFGGGSGSFDDMASHLEMETSVGDLGPGDFTLECWIYTNVELGYYRTLCGNFGGWIGPSRVWQLLNLSGSGTLGLMYVDDYGSGHDVTGVNATIPVGEWSHYALVRSGGTVQSFVNGVSQGTDSLGQDFSSPTQDGSPAPFWLGHTPENIYGRNWYGYIDDLRITKGVARYTADFTPPTVAFPNGPVTTASMPEVSTALLLHFDGANGSTTFTDSSPNMLTVTAHGNAVISTAQSKFGGASVYFDGYGDLSFTPTDATKFGTGDFTVEFWLHATDAPQDNQVIVSLCVWPNSTGFVINYGNSVITILDGNFNNYRCVEVGSFNQWHHYAFVRQSGEVNVYVDGMSAAFTAQQGNLDGDFTDGLQYIGRPTDVDYYKLFGYLDELRIVKGQALYAADFTPPTIPFASAPAPSPVPSLLLHFDGADGGTTFTDNGAKQLTVTANGNAQISTITKKFGSGSFKASINPESDLTIPNNPAISLGGSDWTIEGWVYLNSLRNYNGLVGKRVMDGTENGLGGILILDDGSLHVTANTEGISGWPVNNDVANGFVTNQWQHFAVVRSGDTIYGYRDGVQGTPCPISGAITDSTQDMTVGSAAATGQFLDGYIDEFRIVKGQALYTENFNPPAAPFLDPIFTTTGGGSDPTPDALAFWHLENADGLSSIPADVGSYTMNVAGYSSTTGHTGNGFSFSDSSQGLWTNEQILNAKTNPTSFSCAFWYKQPDGTTYVDVCGNYFGSLGFGFFTNTTFYGPKQNGMAFLIGKGVNYAGNSYTVLESNLPIENDVWFHVVGTYDRPTQTAKLYINGVEVASQNNVPCTGGEHPYWHGFALNGSARYSDKEGGQTCSFDEVGIWDRVLTPAEISFLSGSSAGAPSTYFYDNSKHHHEVTASGAAQISTTEFKYGNASGKFDGMVGTKVTVLDSNPAIFEFDGDFTVEAWVYPTSVSGNKEIVSRYTGSNNAWVFRLQDGQLAWYAGADTGDYYQYGTVVTGQWQHVSISRSGTSVKMFVDGVQVGSTQTNSGTMTAGTAGCTIGASDESSFEFPFDGYIDDLRITKGVARYTADFTPPTREFADPLDTAPPVGDPYAEDVVLLLHMDGADGSTVFTDNSYLQNTVTASGSAAVSIAQSKWGGASLDVTAAGKKLVVDAGDASALGSGDFTLECWLYWTGQISGFYSWGAIAATATAPNPGGWYFLIDTNTNNGVANALMWIDAESGFLSGTASVPVNQWCHVAVVRTASVIKMYLNGVYCGGGNSPTNINDNLPLAIGADNGEAGYVLAYIDDLRITKGVARYTADFTPPTATFPNPFVPENTADLLLHFDGANGSTTFTDSSANALTTTATGGIQLSNTQSKFGATSAHFPADYGFSASGYLTTTNASGALDLQADFTIECFFYPTTYDNGGANGGCQCLFAGANDFTYGVMMYLDGTIGMWASSGSGWNLANGVFGSNYVTLNAWNHIAFVRQGSVFTLFLNGQVEAQTDSGVSDPVAAADLRIGVWGNGQSPINDGYFDEFRITNGTAVYTADFTPPTAPFTGGFTPNLVTGNDLWLDAADSDFTTYNDTVLGWSDLSGSNNNASNADYAPVPTLATGATPTGKDAVHFNGDPNVLKVNHQFALKDSSGFVVVRQTSQSNGSGYPRILGFQPLTGQDDFQNDGLCLVINQDGGDAIEVFSGNQNCSANVTLPLGWSVIGHTIDSEGTVRLRKDGVEVASFLNSSMASMAGAELLLGFGGGFQSYESLQGDIAAVVHYDHKLGIGALAAVEKYLTDKFLSVAGGLTEGLLAFYRLDDAADSSGNGNTMTINSPSFTPGLIGNCLSIQGGTYGHVQFPSTNSDQILANGVSVICWFNWSGDNSTYHRIFSNSLFNAQIYPGGNFAVEGPYNHDFGYSPTANNWHHVVVMLKSAGSNVNRIVYYDGGKILDETFSGWSSTNSQPFDFYLGDPSFNFSGQVDAAGVWTRLLTDSEVAQLYNNGNGTETLTGGGGNSGGQTALLLHFDGGEGDNQFIDSSPNMLTVTAGGNAQTSTNEIKFGPTVAYFDFVNNSYLQIASNDAFNLTGDEPFTVEFWMNMILYSDSYTTVITRRTGVNWQWLCGFSNPATRNLYLSANSSGPVSELMTPFELNLNQWYHVAACYQNGTMSLYVDGVLADSGPWAVQPDNGADLWIAQQGSGGEFFHGFIDELRIVKGEAVYTANFTPPTQAFGGPSFEPASDPYYADVKYLNRFTSASTLEPEWRGSKYGGGTTLPSFDTAPSGCPNSTALFGTQGVGMYSNAPLDGSGFLPNIVQDFTYEFWMYTESVDPSRGANDYAFPVLRSDGGDPFSVTMSGDKSLSISSYDGCLPADSYSVVARTAANIVKLGRWQHIALVGKAGQFTALFVDGVNACSVNQSPSCSGNPAYWEAIDGHDFDMYANVYMSNMRLTQAARYESNFYPVFVNFYEQ